MSSLLRSDFEPTDVEMTQARGYATVYGEEGGAAIALTDVETLVECLAADGLEPSDAILPAMRRMVAGFRVMREHQHARGERTLARLGALATAKAAD